jgi:hypothetical protein
MNRLAAGHAWARSQGWLRRFTLANRLLLAMAFLPTGLVKATGQRFTLLPVETPVGFFFEAMYQTGPWWVFVGVVQVAAALLLLVPRTAPLGALIFLPVAFSIFLITWGVGFGNTVVVTGGMFLSALYLVCWDGDRIGRAVGVLLDEAPAPTPLLAGAGGLERAGWSLGGAAGLGIFLAIRGFVPTAFVVPLLLAGGAAALMVVGSWAAEAARGRGGSRSPRREPA